MNNLTSTHPDIAPWLKRHRVIEERHDERSHCLYILSTYTADLYTADQHVEYQLIRAFYVGKTVHVSVDSRGSAEDVMRHMMERL